MPVSLVVPVFNSQTWLRRLHQSIVEHTASSEFDFEILYVDDHSTDGSLAVLREIEAQAANVVVVEQLRRRGQSRSVLNGICQARNEVIVTLDDDLQHPPRDIVRLLAAIEGASPATLVMGIPVSLKRPIWRAWSGICANAISNLFLPKPLPLRLTTFCAMQRQLCATLDPASDEELSLITALVQAADSLRTIPINMGSSLRAASGYNLASLFRLFASRSKYYKLSRVLGWAAVACLLTVASAARLLTQDATSDPVPAALLLACTTVPSLMLTALAIRVAFYTHGTDHKPKRLPAR
jgi:glycosyltransferase involved in cell wall biosynthesis